jgi:hypothetical protein
MAATSRPNGRIARRPFSTITLKAGRSRADLIVEVTKLSTGRKPPMAEGAARDAGDVILGWLTRIVIGLAITSVIGFDGLSIGVAHVSARDDANSAAIAASTTWRSDHGDLAATYQAAESSAALHNETVLESSVHVDADGTVHLKLRHDATTLAVRHLAPLRSWTVVIVNGTGRAALIS